MAGNADDRARTHDFAGLRAGHVVLADMDAIGARRVGKVGPVVDDKRHVMGVADGKQRLHGVPDFLVGGVLQAQLQAGDVARFQRFG